jgi:photosystem II stability/assembly factor-like uncharacterized protein
MKTFFVLLLVATTTLAGWSTHGPTGGAATAVVVAPSDPNTIWAASSAGVFRSVDGGATWSGVGGPIADVRFLAVSAADADKAWAAAGVHAHIYRTADGGASWTDVTAGLPASLNPSSFFADPREPDTIYVSNSCVETPRFAGVFKSADGGATWQPLALPKSGWLNCVSSLAIDPFSPWRMFTEPADYEFGVPMESYDGGATWEYEREGPRPDTAVVFDARFPFTHYGIGQHHLFVVSQDGGFTWKSVPTAAIGDGDLFFRSGRLGTSLAMDPERSRIFLGASDGVFRSGNGGTVFARTALQGVPVNALAFGGTPRALFAATADGLISLQNRGLGAARPVDLGDASTSVQGIAVDPHFVYASAKGGRVYRSGDDGATWQHIAGDSGTDALGVLSAGADGELYGLPFFAAKTLYRRKPGDDAWRITTLANGGFVAADPKTAGTAFLVDGGAVLRTRDGGDTWQKVAELPPPLGHVTIDPSDPRSVYAVGNRQLLRSSDGGDTWTSIASDTGGEIVVAPSNGNVLYRFAAGSALQRSDDRGTTWRTILQPVLAPDSVAVDPRDADSVWIGGLPLMHSADGGATWQEVQPPFLASFGAAQLRFSKDGVLHVVFAGGHGVWELTTD